MEGQSGTPWAAWRRVPVGGEGLQELLALQPTPELRIQSRATAQVLDLLDVAVLGRDDVAQVDLLQVLALQAVGNFYVDGGLERGRRRQRSGRLQLALSSAVGLEAAGGVAVETWSPRAQPFAPRSLGFPLAARQRLAAVEAVALWRTPSPLPARRGIGPPPHFALW